jgi:hypothetical protein
LIYPRFAASISSAPFSIIVSNAKEFCFPCLRDSYDFELRRSLEICAVESNWSELRDSYGFAVGAGLRSNR